MNRAEHRLASMCRVYEVSPEGCYGSPKITREMHKCGFTIGQKRVARLIREHGMNRVKKMNDNAFIESFFHQFKTERLKGLKA